MNSSKEKKIIMKIQEGKQRPFKQLYNQYASYALRTAFAMTRNKADASDIVQETFIRVYRNIHSFDIDKPFKPWFYRILINEGKRLLNKRQKEAIHVESEKALDYVQQSFAEEAGHEKMLEALDYLSEEDRTLMILKYVDRFTEKELAEMMELNVNTLKSRLLRTRKRLKDAYEGGGFHEKR